MSVPWHFITDINHDGYITITDVFGWLSWLFFLPGDSIIYFLIIKYPNITRFFEIGFDNYRGFLSAILSIIFYFSFVSFVSPYT